MVSRCTFCVQGDGHESDLSWSNFSFSCKRTQGGHALARLYTTWSRVLSSVSDSLKIRCRFLGRHETCCVTTQISDAKQIHPEPFGKYTRNKNFHQRNRLRLFNCWCNWPPIIRPLNLKFNLMESTSVFEAISMRAYRNEF